MVSLREFARQHGVSPTAISRAVRSKRLPSTGGKIDLAIAGPIWDRIKDPARAGRKLKRRGAGPRSVPTLPESATKKDPSAGNGQEHSFDDAKTQREYVRLEREQIQLARLRGSLVDRAEVQSEFIALIMRSKVKLLRLGHKLAPKVALESDQGVCQSLISDGIREALEDLAGGSKRK